MARFGQGLFSGSGGTGLNLMNAQLAEVGERLGSAVPTAKRVMQERQDETQFRQLMSQAQQALASEDSSALATIAANLSQMGKQEQAMALSQAAQKISGKSTASAQSRGAQGGLMAITQAAARGVPLERLQEGINSVLNQGATREQIQDAYEDGLPKAAGADITSSRSAGQYVDEEGNYFEVDIQRTSSGTRKQYVPISPDAPNTPVGRVTPVGGQYMETAEQATGRRVSEASEETLAKRFSESRAEAINNLPAIEKSIFNAEKSLEILDQIDTGGFDTAVKRSIENFLGETAPDEASFALLAGQRVLDGLQAFPGAISEGERAYLENLYESLKRSKGANRAILNEMLDANKRALRDAKLKAGSSNEKEYLKNRQDYSEDLEPEKAEPTVNFEYDPETRELKPV